MFLQGIFLPYANLIIVRLVIIKFNWFYIKNYIGELYFGIYPQP